MDERNPNWHHQIMVVDREEITIDGITNLGSYDDRQIVLETDQGMLVLKGEDLNVKQLNLEKGNIIVEGFLKSIEYDDTRGQKKGVGFFGRLLK
jgi:sporulation protein YabP